LSIIVTGNVLLERNLPASTWSLLGQTSLHHCKLTEQC